MDAVTTMGNSAASSTEVSALSTRARQHQHTHLRELTRDDFEERLAAAAQGQRRLSPRPVSQSWARTEMSIAEILDVVDRMPSTDSPDHRRRRHRAVRKFLEWLQQWPGRTWQERWKASGCEDHADQWVQHVLRTYPSGGKLAYRRTDIHTGINGLMCAQVIRASYRWLLAQHFTRIRKTVCRTFDADGFARLEAHCEATGRTDATRHGAIGSIATILLAKGGRIADITVDDCVELGNAQASTLRSARNVLLFYTLLFEIGVLGPDAPPNLSAARNRGQLTPAEMVEGYGIQAPGVRSLLIAYLSVRKPDLDYSSLRGVATHLCLIFWRDIETHHPGVDTLDLAPEIVTAWKQRVQTVRFSDGKTGRQRVQPERILLTVRALYLDLAQWALEDPARWSRWAVPCPIRANECLNSKKDRRQRARIQQRTRQLAPVLPALVATVEQNRVLAEQRLAAGRRARTGEEFTVIGETFVRAGGANSQYVYVRDTAGRRRELAREENHAFWAWAVVEVLRHTGARIEELLELTHYSFVAYTLPTTGEVVPMLQIAPSKTDTERLILISPELGDVLTAIIHRVRNGKDALPLVSRWDHHEQTTSPLLPFLFQYRRYNIDVAITRSFVANVLDRALDSSGLTDPGGNPIRFTPHDFRRVFATDAIRTGLPPHIAATILGHADINTTMRYAAIYSDDIIAHHRAFIARRRALRPSEEYRDLTPEEWDEFLGHFELRKVALGVCTRDFGSPCIHEHACIRCPQLRPDPEQRPRLEEIRTNLSDRLEEAKQQGWLGEVAAIEASLAAAEQKLATMQQLAARHSPTHLGMPDFHSATGRHTHT